MPMTARASRGDLLGLTRGVKVVVVGGVERVVLVVLVRDSLAGEAAGSGGPGGQR